MISVGKHKSTQNSLPSDICFDLYLATWKETSVHQDICPNSSVIERHKGVLCLYKVRLAEERRDLVPTVTFISTNNLNLGYYWSLFVKGTCRQQYCLLLLHLDSESEKSFLGGSSTSLHLDGQWKNKWKWRKGKNMGFSRNKLYLLNETTKLIFLFIENFRVFTISHLIHHSDRSPWLDSSSNIFASTTVEKSNIFNKCFYI